MPPKASASSKQGPKKAEKKPQIQLDDFFTRFLFKKKRNLNKKLQKIEALEQTPAAELNEQQREVLGSKKDTLEKLSYFDKIQDLYYEAYATKDDEDEEGQAAPKGEKAAPAQTAQAPAPVQVDESEVNRRNARSIAELVTVSAFFQRPHNRETYTRANGQQVKRLGNNFLDNIGSLWRSVTDVFEVENQERTQEVAKIVENFLNSSESLSSAANQSYRKLNEGISSLANEESFRLSSHAEPPAPEARAQLQEEEPARKGSEVKLVKNSKPASRKVSHQQSPVKEDDLQEERQKPAEHQNFSKKAAKEVDPDEPQNTDDGWIPVAAGAAQGKGRGRVGGRGGRGGRGRPDGERRERREGDGGERRERLEGEGGERRERREGEGGDRRERREGERGERRERREGEGGERRERREGEGGERRERREGEGGERRERREGEGGERRERRDDRGEGRQEGRTEYRGEGRHFRREDDGQRPPLTDAEREARRERRERREAEHRPYDGERRERRGGYRGGDGTRRPRPEGGDRRPRDGDRPREQGTEGARTES